MNSQKFYIETFGCSANVADGEIIAGLLKENSIRPVKKPNEADINILVTCTVKTATSHRMLHRIKELSSCNSPLVIAGCMTKTERDLIENINPYASLLGPEDIDKIVETVRNAIRGRRNIYLNGSSQPKLLFPRIRRNQIIGIIKISSGCLGKCSFCQVKIAKQKLTSYTPQSIKNEVKQAIYEGCKEIWLTSQDNGCYGKDIGYDLIYLTKSLLDIKKDFKIRLGMMNPGHLYKMLEEIIPIIKNKKFFKFLHIPIQSGSNNVLIAMRRNHTLIEFITIAKRFRNVFPLSTLSTDIIVGFPNETDTDFQKTVDLIRKLKPDNVNISKYGARPGTESETMPQLDVKVVNERSKTLHNIVNEIKLLNNQKWINWSGKVLIDENVREAVLGRNFAYKPVVIKKTFPIGTTIDLKVIGATSSCLIGEPI